MLNFWCHRNKSDDNFFGQASSRWDEGRERTCVSEVSMHAW